MPQWFDNGPLSEVALRASPSSLRILMPDRAGASVGTVAPGKFMPVVSLDQQLPPLVVALIVARWAASLWLERLNRRTVLAHADAVPEAFKGVMDDATYAKSVQYTLASARLSRVEITYDSIVLLVVLFSGVLPWGFGLFTRWLGTSAWAMAAFLCAVGVALALPSLPLDWYDQFRLEARFGFNTTTQKIWWLDRLKGLLLGLALGFPLLVLVLKLVDWMGALWWLWAWGALLAFQLLMAVLAPVLIMPLFNKFTPLPEGSLRDRLLTLAERTGFRAGASRSWTAANARGTRTPSSPASAASAKSCSSTPWSSN